MKKTAIVLDFKPKLKQPLSTLTHDVYIIDRYHEKITTVETYNQDIPTFEEEVTFSDFYQRIASNYENILCLFLSYKYTDIEDHLLTKRINQNRLNYQAKMYTYLINFKNQDRDKIVEQSCEMISKGYDVKDIIIRINQIKNEPFALTDIVFNYISSLI